MIELDGAYLEGGGAILRVATGLSAFTGKPFHIYNIRKNRPKPGLAAQHLTGIKAVAQICSARVIGAEIGSTEVEFVPGKIEPGNYSFDVGTAGSVTLVLQALLIPAIGSGKEFSFQVKGGTDVPWSPTTTYMTSIFCKILERLGANTRLETVRHGFYPKGGGMVRLQTEESRLNAMNLTQRNGEPVIDCLSIASSELKQRKVAERQVEAAEKILGKIDRKMKYVDTHSPGSAITMHAHFSNTTIGSSAIGERGRSAEDVGAHAATFLKKQLESNACLDEWMSDQILPYLAMAASSGESSVSVAEATKHALTNIWVIEKFLPVKFSVKGKEGEPGITSVEKS